MMSTLPRIYAPRRILNTYRLKRKSSVLAVDIRADLGFFAQLNWCLYILAYCEQYELIPRIRLIGGNYAEEEGHDWLHDFLVERDEAEFSGRIRSSTAHRITHLSIQHIRETQFAIQFAPFMTIEWAHRLFTGQYAIAPLVASYVDTFVEREFASDGVIGLHFRGTDKKCEAQPVEWPSCLRSVVRYAEDHPLMRQVFISSDDPKFVEWFAQEAKGTLSVISHGDEERSRDSQPVHTNRTGSGHRKGFEALVNCLLLSRCTALIRTASFLSGWSSIFNPSLPITLLNEPYEHTRWFPDRELIQKSDNRYR